MTTATIVGLASTQSRGRRPGKKVTLVGASGVHEFTSDGRQILSWVLGQYGPLLGFPSLENPLTIELVMKLRDAMRMGDASLGDYPPELEQRLADKLVSLYAPYLRSLDIGIRFFSNGTDATQAAVALARYATGRDAFVSVGYHGGSSPVFGFAPQNGGLLKSESEARYDVSFENMSLAQMDAFDGIACAVMEMPAVENEQDAADKLFNISDYYCVGSRYRSSDSYFVMDDIVTGFRFAPAGALEYYSKLLPTFDNEDDEEDGGPSRNIKADFICLGKALSTYGKVSALLGPLDIMEALADKVFASYTFNDHPLGFADALYTLDEYDKHASHLYEHRMDASSILGIGERLKQDLNGLFLQYNFPAKCIGHPARSAIVATDDGTKLNTLLSRVVDEHDILLHRPQFVTLAHNLDHVSQTLTAVETVLKSM